MSSAATERFGVRILLTEQVKDDRLLMEAIRADQCRKVAEVVRHAGRQPVGPPEVRLQLTLEPPYFVPRPWWVQALQRLRLMERRQPIKLYAFSVEQLARKG